MATKKDMKKIKPLKKKHKGLKIFLIVLCVILVLPIAFIFGAFYDPSTKNVSKSDIHYENIVAEGFYKGLEGLSEENPKISFTINEEMIDGIMMAACEKINQEKYIPKMYCYINDNDYTFVMDAQLSFFKTRLFIITSLEQDGDNILNFKIDKIKIGRLPLPFTWITGLLSNFISDDKLTEAFSGSGFHIESHLSEGRLTYSREQFKLDVGNYISEKGKDNPYLNLLLNMIGDKEHGILTTDYKDGVTASFNLDLLKLKNSPYETTPPLSFPDLGKHATKITEWLNSGYFGEENVDENVSNVLIYLIRGSKSSEKIKTYINGIEGDFKAALEAYITSEYTLENYPGSAVNVIDEPPGIKRFANYCEETISATFNVVQTPPYSATFSIDGDNINKYLANEMTDGIGRTVPIIYKDENNKWCFNYIVVDNLFVKFKSGGEGEENNPKMVMYLTLNVNGVQISLVLANDNIRINDAKGTEGILGNLTFNLKEKYFGAIPVTDADLLNQILGMLPTGEKEEDMFVYDKDNGAFKINLDKINATGLEDEEVKKIAAGLIEQHGQDIPGTVDDANNTFGFVFPPQP